MASLHRSMKFKWGSQMEIDLIEEYGKHKCLWDPSDPNFFKKQWRASANNQVIRYLSMRYPSYKHRFTHGALNFKFKNLRTYYQRELKKDYVMKSLHGCKDYVPNWKHFERMSFIGDFVNIENAKKLEPQEVDVILNRSKKKQLSLSCSAASTKRRPSLSSSSSSTSQTDILELYPSHLIKEELDTDEASLQEKILVPQYSIKRFNKGKLKMNGNPIPTSNTTVPFTTKLSSEKQTVIDLYGRLLSLRLFAIKSQDLQKNARLEIEDVISRYEELDKMGQ